MFGTLSSRLPTHLIIHRQIKIQMSQSGFSPSSVQSPTVGEPLTLSLTITDGENVAGYQATLIFDTTALKYVQSANADYLPAGAILCPPRR